MCRYKPWYLEECSSTLATTYSSGTPGHDKSVATVDMDGKLRPDHICTVEHTGMTRYHFMLVSAIKRTLRLIY
jgi:hypothetical protein